METSLDETQPAIYWGEADPDGLLAAEAADLAGALGEDDRLRASSPEIAADDPVRSDAGPFARADAA